MEKYLKMPAGFNGGAEWFGNAMRDDMTASDVLIDAAVHAINSHDELVAINKELLAVVNNFHITEPDEDGCVWLVLNGNGTTGMAMFNLANGDRIAAKVALHLESDRKAAIIKAKAAS